MSDEGRTYIDVRLYVTVDDANAEFAGVSNPTPTEVVNWIKAQTQGPLSIVSIDEFRISDYGLEGPHAEYSATKASEERYQGNG